MGAKARYDFLAGRERSQFLNRARHNALLSIPSLMPLEGHTDSSHLIEPYQGMGSDGTVNLASRIGMGLMPAGRPYMRLDLPPEVKLQNNGETDKDTTKGLALSEQLIQGEVESKSWREATIQSLEQLIVAGSVMEFVQPDNTIRVFRLDQFVVRRDHRGKMIEAIILEKFDSRSAPITLENVPGGQQSSEVGDDQVELYTVIELVQEPTREFYRRTQEWASGTRASEPTTWPVEDVPYLPLRWSSIPGEDYGRSKIEEHIADLRSLDSLEKASLEMAGMASRNFIMIAPGAGMSGLKRRIVTALNGDVVVGDPNAVELKSFDNTQGFQITQAQVQQLRASLSKAFLLLSAGQRDAERVTAAEIERDVAELEAALGGTFSTLNLNMMEARTRVLMNQMKEQNKLPDFPEGAVVPTILTGLEALSRERDVSRAAQAAELTQAFGEGASDNVKLDKVLTRAYVGLGFPDAIRTEEETVAFRQQRAEQEALLRGAGAAIPAIAKEEAKQSGDK